MWDLIVLIPNYCITIYFERINLAPSSPDYAPMDLADVFCTAQVGPARKTSL